jgi:predicted methyltransferase
MISNAYHEFTDPRPMLRHIREALKPGGKLVVLEAITPKMLDRSRDEQVRVHELAPAIVEGELETAGFRQVELVILREGEGTTRYLVSAQPE